ncbi:transglycosylase family protein [Streptomyces sp. NPDC058471]|uniref:LysM peptidoglycan-binding domain-containing protein n=1 Tax=Streptomyces sp. NPDC058471 TaxID=3346516 RepID=UPI003655D701
MTKGRHAKPNESNTTKRIAVGASVLIGGSIIPVAFVGSASAASIDSWDRVAQCESNGQWSLPGGDLDSTGGLQFRVASWGDSLSYLRSHGVDTSSYPSMPYQATKEQQILAGEALLAMQGPSAWSVTFNGGAHCGNAAGGALSEGSMFEGGPRPFQSEPAAPEPTSPTPPPPVASEDGTYTVRLGDTLADVAAANSVPGGWQALYEANKDVIGPSPDRIEVGQKLDTEIPAATPTPAVGSYRVKPGDCLASVAREHNITGGWQALYAANKAAVGGDPDLIHPGLVLNL